MNVSSPPLNRNRIGAAGGGDPGSVITLRISRRMPTHDAQSAPPGLPRVVSKCAFRRTDLASLGADFGATLTTTFVRLVYALAMSLLRKLRRKDPVGRCIEISTSMSSALAADASSTSSLARSATYLSAGSIPGVATTRGPIPSASSRACINARSSLNLD